MPTDADNGPTLESLPDDAPIDQVRAALNRERQRRTEAEQGLSDAENLRRENAFLKAGVDADSPIGKLFTRGYDGELDVEAIKTAWTEIRPGEPTPPPTTETTPPPTDSVEGVTGLSTEELERLRQARASLSTDSAPPGALPQTPVMQAMMDAAFEKQGGVKARPAQGMNDASLNAGFSTLFGRAIEGDQEAVFKSPNEDWATATDRWRRSKS